MVNGTAKEADKFKMDEYTKKGGMVIVDPDENEIIRGSFLYRSQGQAAPEKALEIINGALKIYAPKEIDWLDSLEKGVELAKDGKKLLFIAFADDQQDSLKTLKALENPFLVKTNEKFVFVKVKTAKKPDKPSAKKETDEEKKKREAEIAVSLAQMDKWKVSSAPVIFIVDPGEPEPEKKPLQKITGLRDTVYLKKNMNKALDDYRKSQEEKKQKEEKEKK